MVKPCKYSDFKLSSHYYCCTFVFMKIWKIFFILLLFQISFSASCLPADTDDISNRKYFPAVKKLIQEAGKEIKISIYYISFTSKGPVSELLSELVKAKKRGVDIEIVLDWDSTPEVLNRDDMKNVKAFSFLKQNGIKVFYDDNKALNHSKYLIIDREILVVGSHNWSTSAFDFNHESTLLVRSRELAALYLQYFKDLPKVLPATVKGAIPIPAEFVENPNLAPRMVKKYEYTLFEFYLLCQKLSFEQKNRKIIITEEVLNEFFFRGKNLDMQKRSLQGYFTLIYLKRTKTWQTFMESYTINKEEKVLEVTLKQENTGNEKSLWLSELYWSDRWFERLQDSSKYFFLFLLLKTDSGKLGRSYTVTRAEITESSAINMTTLSYASAQLARFNLIEKQVLSRKDDYEPNIYILNDFYVYADFEKKLQKIKEETDPALFEIALQICDVTNEPHDPESLKKVIAIGKKHGITLLKKAFDKADSSHTGSSYRHLGYLMGTMEGWIKEDPEYMKP